MKNRIATKLLVPITLTAMASCGPFAENTDKPSGVYVGPPTVVSGGEEVRVATSPPSSGGKEISGLSCQNKIWNPAPDEQTAIAVLKRETAQAGFNSVYVTSVTTDSGALLKNCWAAIVAKGIAFNS